MIATDKLEKRIKERQKFAKLEDESEKEKRKELK